VDRLQFQRLSDLRLKDAEILLEAQRWDAAYYLLGYSIECALKACIARQFRADDVPDKRLVNSFYTHDLDKLLDLTDLRLEMERGESRISDFAISWNLITKWSETLRYDENRSGVDAWEMYDAVKSVLQWLKKQY
jgi:HEPN domain-containing protein